MRKQKTRHLYQQTGTHIKVYLGMYVCVSSMRLRPHRERHLCHTLSSTSISRSEWLWLLCLLVRVGWWMDVRNGRDGPGRIYIMGRVCTHPSVHLSALAFVC